ncbi:TetR/AcrR family transcriptional regulator [Nonomuraea glycinis]|uniref:TetR family transcriptional regulator n=1 Tax=Nonomuraea glycinis TaxID=2047744 RepID=A0A918A4Z2_9ACTN|nr:TetR/AcrR family transcriptional regulator [Nonomuraea glycinis]MCA2176352.1 TetR/AcrR family transcriptional regulator [Nonomuraea glycinis]GGP07345.1 TetR family transcriptional regulator [Nonomuraea glycinis]
MTRRTQAERSDATTALLITTAQRLFGAHGYAATSIDAVAAAAGVTKGAVYHHFGGKTALFRAAFVREQEETAATLERVAFEQSDGWAALRRGIRTFLEHCLDPGFRQIVILDGPSVLGWETVREIEYGHALRVLLDGMRLAQAEGLFAEGDLPARAQLVFGALCEGGMLLARAADPVAALPGLAAEADRLLEAFKV